MKPTARASFTLLLPLFSILIWMALVVSPTLFYYFRILHVANGAPSVTWSVGDFTITTSRERFFYLALEHTSFRWNHTIEAINMPGHFANLLIARLSPSWPEAWHPRSFDFHTWNTVIFPFYCLPVWYFAGFGFDALFRYRTVRWPWLLIGTLLCAGFFFIGLGLYFGLSASEREGIRYPLFWGCYLWGFLLAAFPIAWVQTIVRHRQKAKLNS